MTVYYGDSGLAVPEDHRCRGCDKYPQTTMGWPTCTVCGESVCYGCRDDLGRCPLCASVDARERKGRGR